MTRTPSYSYYYYYYYASSEGSPTFVISSLLPFGLFPLLFALTPPSIATFFSAIIMLAGYSCLDYGVSVFSIPLSLFFFLRLMICI